MATRAVLVGLPGVGKSTVGAALARRLGCEFADSDDLVIHMAGRTPGQIILDDGEAAFRDVEATVIADTLLDFDGVLALGGGAITTESVRDALRDSGVPVVLLTASVEELVARIGSTSHRPLLAGDTAARLEQLSAEREALYTALATETVDTDSASVDEIAAEVAARLDGAR